MYLFIYNILHIVSNPTCFNASVSSSGSLNIVLANVKKNIRIIKITTQ